MLSYLVINWAPMVATHCRRNRVKKCGSSSRCFLFALLSDASLPVRFGSWQVGLYAVRRHVARCWSLCSYSTCMFCCRLAELTCPAWCAPVPLCCGGKCPLCLHNLGWYTFKLTLAWLQVNASSRMLLSLSHCHACVSDSAKRYVVVLLQHLKPVWFLCSF